MVEDDRREVLPRLWLEPKPIPDRLLELEELPKPPDPKLLDPKPLEPRLLDPMPPPEEPLPLLLEPPMPELPVPAPDLNGLVPLPPDDELLPEDEPLDVPKRLLSTPSIFTALAFFSE
jgi:hypothetical protein